MADNNATPSTSDANAPAAQGRGFFGSIAHGWNVLNSARDRGMNTAVSFVVGGAVDLVDSVPKIAGYDSISKQISGADLNARTNMHNWLEGNRRQAEIIIHGEEIKPETAVERGLDVTGDFLGGLALGPAARVGGIVKVGTATLKGSTALTAATTTAEKSVAPIDALVDFLANGNRAMTSNFVASTRFGGIEAAKLAGLTSANAFANASSTMIKGAKILSPAASTVGMLAANSTITGARLLTTGTLAAVTKTAGFSLRHPVLATGAFVGADTMLNDGALTAAATKKAIQSVPQIAASTFNMAGGILPAITPRINYQNWFKTADGRPRPVMKALEEGMGIDIPDAWEAKGNQLMRDFGTSSFGQWLMSDSMAAKFLLGIIAFVLLSGIKNMTVGDSLNSISPALNTGANMLNMGVAAVASQMLPDLLRAMTESTLDPSTPKPELRPQTLDFAPSNMGGMSFAPAP